MTIANCYPPKIKIIDALFIVFCMFPFIIPNPVVVTNIQPYAAIFGTVIVMSFIAKKKILVHFSKTGLFFAVAWVTLLVSIIVFAFSGVNIASLRALFNYYSVAIVPSAFYIVLQRMESFPEKMLKSMILIWFAVSTIQFFINRSFLTSIIGGVRFSYSYRGVVGLASEPSFLGISCFYFLHIANRFEKKQLLYFIVISVMGVVYAQSIMGVLFIGAFAIVYLFDKTNTKKGYWAWAGAIIALVGFYIVLNRFFVGTRLYQLISIFLQDGVSGILVDASAESRYNTYFGAIKDSWDSYLLPMGFSRRIGSGYGGFLCELGFLALPILIGISFTMSQTFKKNSSRIIYFFIITILLFNNTQLGNPLLLIVIAINLYYKVQMPVPCGIYPLNIAGKQYKNNIREGKGRSKGNNQDDVQIQEGRNSGKNNMRRPCKSMPEHNVETCNIGFFGIPER